MNILNQIPERLRGFFYLALALMFLIMLAAMFVVAIINGEDMSDWVPFILGILGFAGTGLASANTSRQNNDHEGL